VEKNLPREINYLRLSITDRCNLRCVYCTAWDKWEKLPAREILRYEEMLHLVAVAVRAGIRKVRVTGGEPLVRRGVGEFIHTLHQVSGLAEVCLTTNGVLLNDLAGTLHAAGLRHVNVSLDSLRRSRYRELTGSDNLQEVLAGLERAAALGFNPLKINCVVLKGINDDELLDFALLARDYPYQVRFIEFMPTISQEGWRSHFLPMEAVRGRLAAALGEGVAASRNATAGPACIFRYPGFRGELGFINTVSQHHCPTCNRLRLTAAGRLRPCLFAAPELDLKGPLRRGESKESLAQIFREAMQRKATSRDGLLPGRAMIGIGG
jgi:cyclic pyranopterin phosphate synthase